MENQENAVVVAEQPKTSLKTKVGTALAIGATYAVTAMPAHADGDLTAVGTAFTGQLDSAKGVIITILSAAAIVLGLLVGWRYMKRGGNSA